MQMNRDTGSTPGPSLRGCLVQNISRRSFRSIIQYNIARRVEVGNTPSTMHAYNGTSTISLRKRVSIRKTSGKQIDGSR
jgi:hypothetical protein